MSRYLNFGLGLFLSLTGLFAIYNAFSLLTTFNWIVVGIVALIFGIYFLIASFEGIFTKNVTEEETVKEKKSFVDEDLSKSHNFIRNNETIDFTSNISRPDKITRRPKSIFDMDLENTPEPFEDIDEKKYHRIEETYSYKEYPTSDPSRPKKDFYRKRVIADVHDESEYPSDSEVPNNRIKQLLDNEELFDLDDDIKISNEVIENQKRPLTDLNKSNGLETADKKSTVYPAEILPVNLIESYVIFSYKTVSSDEAVDDLLSKAKKTVRLECSNIAYLKEELINKLSKLDFKLLIEDFNDADLSYKLLIHSLIEQGVEVRTLKHITSINLVVDNKRGLLVSTDPIADRYEIGAVYEDKKSLDKINLIFDMLWDIAEPLSNSDF